MGFRKHWALFAALVTGTGVVTIISLLAQAGTAFGGHPCAIKRPSERADTTDKTDHIDGEIKDEPSL